MYLSKQKINLLLALICISASVISFQNCAKNPAEFHTENNSILNSGSNVSIPAVDINKPFKLIADNLKGPGAIASDKFGNLYYSSTYRFYIIKPNGQQIELIISNLDELKTWYLEVPTRKMVVDNSGNIYFVVGYFGGYDFYYLKKQDSLNYVAYKIDAYPGKYLYHISFSRTENKIYVNSDYAHYITFDLSASLKKEIFQNSYDYMKQNVPGSYSQGIEGSGDSNLPGNSFVIDQNRNIYVVMTTFGNVSSMTKLDKKQNFLSNWSGGETGFADGNGLGTKREYFKNLLTNEYVLIGGPFPAYNGLIYITSDSSDNMYMIDSGNKAIRKITTDGVVTTVTTRFENLKQLAITSSGICALQSKSERVYAIHCQ